MWSYLKDHVRPFDGASSRERVRGGLEPISIGSTRWQGNIYRTVSANTRWCPRRNYRAVGARRLDRIKQMCLRCAFSSDDKFAAAGVLKSFLTRKKYWWGLSPNSTKMSSPLPPPQCLHFSANPNTSCASLFVCALSVAPGLRNGDMRRELCAPRGSRVRRRSELCATPAAARIADFRESGEGGALPSSESW